MSIYVSLHSGMTVESLMKATWHFCDFPKFWEKLRDGLKSLVDKAHTSPLLLEEARLEVRVCWSNTEPRKYRPQWPAWAPHLAQKVNSDYDLEYHREITSQRETPLPKEKELSQGFTSLHHSIGDSFHLPADGVNEDVVCFMLELCGSGEEFTPI